eukprot:jgi/Astpho2/4067/Aster-x0619
MRSSQDLSPAQQLQADIDHSDKDNSVEPGQSGSASSELDGDEDDAALEAAMFASDNEQDLSEEEEQGGDEQAEQAQLAVVPSASDETPQQLALAEYTAQVMGIMSQEELDRYELFRRSKLSKAVLKRVMEAVAGSKCNDQMLIVMGAVVKLFVGDLVETARQIGHELNEISQDGRLQPSHYRMAFQQLESQGKILQTRPRKRMRL